MREQERVPEGEGVCVTEKESDGEGDAVGGLGARVAVTEAVGEGTEAVEERGVLPEVVRVGGVGEGDAGLCVAVDWDWVRVAESSEGVGD